MNKKQSSIIQIAAFSITALVLIGILIAGLTGHLWNGNFQMFNLGSGNHYRDAEKYTAGEGEVKAEGINDIEVNWLDGTINVSVYDGDTIKFSESSHKSLDDKDQLHYYVNNGKLIVQYKSPRKSFFAFDPSLNKSLELMIPKKIATELTRLSIDSVSSETKITDVNANFVSFDSISGDASLDNCTVTELSFDSTSGSLLGNRLAVSYELSADTTSGSVRVAGSIAKVDFDTVSGALELDSDICPQEISTDSISGAVNLTIPDNPGFTCSKDSVSGSFTSNFEVSWHNDRGTYKNGNADFSFESVSGNINITRK